MANQTVRMGRKATGPCNEVAGPPKSRAELSTHTYGETPKAGFEKFDNSAFFIINIYNQGQRKNKARAFGNIRKVFEN